ncbi:MAG TPA: VTT domain-containing protein [Coxiellaceae bacterium]|nr:VTT domain-containing protein [Coxiellaceae bacterium]
MDMMYWISTLGYLGIFLVIFLECGCMVFFLPGDSLLFSAGILAAQNFLNFPLLFAGTLTCAFLGYALSYWWGARLGHWLMKQPDRWWFKKRYLEESKVFYEKNGIKALIIGRLMPIIRTFVPVVAGMVDMPFARFHFCNALGALVWIGLFLGGGYFLGARLPQAEHYLVVLIVSIVVLSMLPGLWHLWKRRQISRRESGDSLPPT